MDIKYKIGDKVRYKTSVYDEDKDCYIPKEKEGYIFTVMIKQEGLFLGKKGSKVSYKVHYDFEGIKGGWVEVSEKAIIEKLGEHLNADKYRVKL